jgi:hypothetical protein
LFGSGFCRHTVANWGSIRVAKENAGVALEWEDWRSVIAVLHITALPSMLEHADHIVRLLEQLAAGEAGVTLSLTDDVVQRSSPWARFQLGILLPPY